MPSFNTEVPHQLGKDQAIDRLKSFLDMVAERYKDQVSNLEGNWNDNVLDFDLTTYGFKIAGTLIVEEEEARLAGKLPMAAMVFRGKIEQSIGDELRKALS